MSFTFHLLPRGWQKFKALAVVLGGSGARLYQYLPPVDREVDGRIKKCFHRKCLIFPCLQSSEEHTRPPPLCPLPTIYIILIPPLTPRYFHQHLRHHLLEKIIWLSSILSQPGSLLYYSLMLFSLDLILLSFHFVVVLHSGCFCREKPGNLAI